MRKLSKSLLVLTLVFMMAVSLIMTSAIQVHAENTSVSENYDQEESSDNISEDSIINEENSNNGETTIDDSLLNEKITNEYSSTTENEIQSEDVNINESEIPSEDINIEEESIEYADSGDDSVNDELSGEASEDMISEEIEDDAVIVTASTGEEAVQADSEEVITCADADLDDNIDITIQGSSNITFTGSGTSYDPYFVSYKYRSARISSIVIATVNPKATIFGIEGGTSFDVAYGENYINFTVISSDNSRTAYYTVMWQRTKESNSRSIPSGTLYTVAATEGNSDGKICGLDASEEYDYKLSSSSEWIHVSNASEITGLVAGKYNVRYGETASQQASQFSSTVRVGSASENMAIKNSSGHNIIELKESASEGERIDIKIAVADNEWIKNDDFVKEVRTYSSYTREDYVTLYFDEYVVENGQKYYTAHFIMPAAPSSSRYTITIEIRVPEISTETYYTISSPEEAYIIADITPASDSDVMTVNKEKVYKEDSSVTIAVSINQDYGTRNLKSFKVVDAEGNTVAESTDGSAVTVAMSEDLTISEVVTETVYADFAALDEQLARLEGVDLYAYTDTTRVAVEEYLYYQANVHTVTQKDQSLVDDFTANLKAAIDALEPKPGDFTEINSLIESIPSDLSIYKADGVSALNSAKAAAQNAVDENWNRLRQSEIDQLADDLDAAIAALEYKDADYTAVDVAIAAANALNKDDYEDFTEVTKAVEAVVRGKNITEQAEVDAMAEAINNAVKALVVKEDKSSDASGTDSENQGSTTAAQTGSTATAQTGSTASAQTGSTTAAQSSNTVSSSATGDSNDMVIWLVILAACAGITAGIYKTKNRNNI